MVKWPKHGLNTDLGSKKNSKSKIYCINFTFFQRFGFSEFNSDTYAPIAFKGMAALVGLSEDSELKQLAEMVMNLQLFDHIIGSKGRR